MNFRQIWQIMWRCAFPLRLLSYSFSLSFAHLAVWYDRKLSCLLTVEYHGLLGLAEAVGREARVSTVVSVVVDADAQTQRQ